MSQKTDFEVNDFCWAKIKGFPTWPSFIVEKKNSKYKVQFLGDNNYSTLQKRKLAIWNKENTDLFLSQSKKYKDLFEGAIFFKELIGNNKLLISDYSDCYKYCYEKEGKWNKDNIQSFVVQNKEDNFVFNSIEIDGKRTPKIVIKCNDDDENINIKNEKKENEENDENEENKNQENKENKNEDNINKNNEDKSISIEKSLRKNNLRNYNNKKKEKTVNDNTNQKKDSKKKNRKGQKKNNNNNTVINNNTHNNNSNNEEKKNNQLLNNKRYRITKSNNFSIIDNKKKKQNVKDNDKQLMDEFIRIGKILFNKK